MKEIRKGSKMSGEVSTGAMGLKCMEIILWDFQCVHWNMLRVKFPPVLKLCLMPLN